MIGYEGSTPWMSRRWSTTLRTLGTSKLPSNQYSVSRSLRLSTGTSRSGRSALKRISRSTSQASSPFSPGKSGIAFARDNSDSGARARVAPIASAHGGGPQPGRAEAGIGGSVSPATGRSKPNWAALPDAAVELAVQKGLAAARGRSCRQRESSAEELEALDHQVHLLEAVAMDLARPGGDPPLRRSGAWRALWR